MWELKNVTKLSLAENEPDIVEKSGTETMISNELTVGAGLKSSCMNLV